MSDMKYTIGLDFGTLSGRALLVRVSDGREMGSAVMDYAHGVMDDELITPCGSQKLPPNWALQHPRDYLQVLAHIIRKVLADCHVDPADVIGVGVDFTTCTLLPVCEDGTPLCFTPSYVSDPHAYVKLWKHHASQKYADMLNEKAAERGEAWLCIYGGKISAEWMFPKIWQTLAEAPEIYRDAAAFIEAGDWIVWQLTGKHTRNSCMTGYKSIYGESGYPSKEFFASLDPRLENVVEDKLAAPVIPVGSCAGYITEEAAKLTGLLPGTVVTAANADAHCAAPAMKVTSPGKMFIIMGTSACHMLVSDQYTTVPGICGVVKDGLIPGLYGYEAGQGCCGDHFAWFTDHFITPDVHKEAEKRQIPPIRIFVERMAKLRPGESGLVALDWWNGNRCPLVDYDLSGTIVGMTLATKPEEIFRALVEATAYGTRMIIENFRDHGLPVHEIVASGGIAKKDPVTMQIYADVLGMDLHIAGSTQGPALGSAIFAAAAAGRARGGYDSLLEASEIMGAVSDTVYRPVRAHTAVYDKLYAEYKLLCGYFGSENGMMKRLLAIRTENSRQND
ncbi:MAG: ribulokinase [Clostridia bacterium]|nr:ribulokinase [Clostridia bacterium]